MIWWDSTAAFKQRFEATEGGYLYYPRANGGGKFLSEAEYDRFVRLYRRWMGTRFRPGLLFRTMIGGGTALALTQLATGMAEEVGTRSTYAFVMGIMAIHLWALPAPQATA